MKNDRGGRLLRRVYYSLPLPLRAKAKHWTLRMLGRRPIRRRNVIVGGLRAGVPGLVSVVLPVYNGARWIDEAVGSVLAQTHRNCELIVVDDGSSDGTGVMCQEVGRRDARVRYAYQEHRGLGAALTLGHRLARGEICTWTSADNRVGLTSLAALVHALESDPDSVLVYTDYRVIDAAGAPMPGGPFRKEDRDPRDRSIVRVPRSDEGLSLGDNFIGCSFAYRAWAHRVVGHWSGELGVEDYDYWLRLRALGRLRFVAPAEDLYEYRVHDESLSARKDELNIRAKLERMLASPTAAVEPPQVVVSDMRAVRKLWIAGFQGERPAPDQLCISVSPEWHAALPCNCRPDSVLADHAPAWRLAGVRVGGERVAPTLPTGVIRVGNYPSGDARRGGLERFASALGSALAARSDVQVVAERPDVVLNHGGAYGGPSAFVEVVHNTYAWLKPWQRDRFLNRLDRAVAVIAVSPEAAAYTVRHFGVAPERVTVIPNGIDVTRLRSGRTRAEVRQALGIPLSAWVWLSVGSIFPPKGQVSAGRAIESAQDEWLVVAGDTVDADYYKRLTASSERVRVCGFQEDVTGLYGAVDALVQPSVVEGWSLALTEALYCGVPVVATAVGSAPELLGLTGAGVLVEPLVDPLELTPERFDEVCLAQSHALVPDLRRAMDALRGESRWSGVVAAARETVAGRFSMDTCADGYARLLHDVRM